MHERGNWMVSFQANWCSIVWYNSTWICVAWKLKVPPLSLCTSCGLAVKHQHAKQKSNINQQNLHDLHHVLSRFKITLQKCIKNNVFVGSNVVSFVISSLLASPGAGRTGTWGTWQLYSADLWIENWSKTQSTQIQMVDLVHFFDICCICEFLYLLYLWISESSKFSRQIHIKLTSGAMSGMLTNLTSEASSKPAHGISRCFEAWKKEVSLVDIFVDIWWCFELFVIWTCTEYQNTIVFLIMLQ